MAKFKVEAATTVRGDHLVLAVVKFINIFPEFINITKYKSNCKKT